MLFPCEGFSFFCVFFTRCLHIYLSSDSFFAYFLQSPCWYKCSCPRGSSSPPLRASILLCTTSGPALASAHFPPEIYFFVTGPLKVASTQTNIYIYLGKTPSAMFIYDTDKMWHSLHSREKVLICNHFGWDHAWYIYFCVFIIICICAAIYVYARSQSLAPPIITVIMNGSNLIYIKKQHCVSILNSLEGAMVRI